MIRKAKAADTPRLIELWALCFSEPVDDRTFFFDRLYRPENALVYEENGHILSMLHALPYMISSRGLLRPVQYFYGIGTDPSARRRGLASQLIAAAKVEAAALGCPFLLLVAEEASLLSYYERFDFFPLLSRSLPVCETVGFRCACRADIPALNRIYEHALLLRPHLLRNCEEWGILLDEMGEVLIGENAYVISSVKGRILEAFGGAARQMPAEPYASFCILDPSFSLENGYFNLLHDE